MVPVIAGWPEQPGPWEKCETWGFGMQALTGGEGDSPVGVESRWTWRPHETTSLERGILGLRARDQASVRMDEWSEQGVRWHGLGILTKEVS